MKLPFDARSVSVLGGALVVLLSACSATPPVAAAEPKWPSVGDEAPDFELEDADGESMKLSRVTKQGPAVLVVLRGFPGYQCPICTRQVAEFIGAADNIRDAGATVVMTYPGPAEELGQRAEEFTAGVNLPQMAKEFAESDVEVATIECHDRYRSRVMVGDELLPQYWFAKQSPQAGYQGAIWWSYLADPAGAVGATYGVQPLAYAVHSEYINRPSTIIIDKEGVVRFAYYGTYWGDRPSIHETLKMIREGQYDFEHPERLQAAR